MPQTVMLFAPANSGPSSNVTTPFSSIHGVGVVPAGGSSCATNGT
ncbi:hypothetical protein [Cellulomonas sp. ATA003]|nr:hypothetical protein [Cellulomonas sp. ATA003]WNB86186.1 hypothetical protein REH70_02630 [Cellulomonas sp. ATA003]